MYNILKTLKLRRGLPSFLPQTLPPLSPHFDAGYCKVEPNTYVSVFMLLFYRVGQHFTSPISQPDKNPNRFRTWVYGISGDILA